MAQRTALDPPVRIAVIGAGFMGSGIGAEFALRAPMVEWVRLWDPADGAAALAVRTAPGVAELLVDAGVVAAADVPSRLARLEAAASREAALDGAGYVVEAAPEDLALKQDLFRSLDDALDPDAVLASNTSSYDPADLASGLRHPERVLVTHYFGPAYLIPLVEVVPHAGTAERTVERTLALLRATGKRPVRLGKFAPGFVANRLQFALFREALHLAREGVATPEGIDDVVRYSFASRLAALGPFGVADFGGLDTYASIIASIWPTLSNETASAAPPPELAALLQTGRRGVKSGAGFYDWPSDRLQTVTARRDAALVDALRRQSRGSE